MDLPSPSPSKRHDPGRADDNKSKKIGQMDCPSERVEGRHNEPENIDNSNQQDEQSDLTETLYIRL
jgi:hypothetical protein